MKDVVDYKLYQQVKRENKALKSDKIKYENALHLVIECLKEYQNMLKVVTSTTYDILYNDLLQYQDFEYWNILGNNLTDVTYIENEVEKLIDQYKHV